VAPPGTYDLLAIFGDAKWLRRNVVIKGNEVIEIPGPLAVDPEVVTIHEKAPAVAPSKPAEVHVASVKRVLPYSDEAIESNLWSVAWLLLDVSEQGKVVSFRFVHRPGHGLDEIAEREAWLLHFEPARDKTGQPVVSKTLWKFEWPAFHLMKQMQFFNATGQGALTTPLQADAQGTSFAVSSRSLSAQSASPAFSTKGISTECANTPSGIGFTGNSHLAAGPMVLPGIAGVPCRGRSPLNLDSNQPTYRDCAVPNLSRLATEKLIVNPRN
jgi:hypothetical protein